MLTLCASNSVSQGSPRGGGQRGERPWRGYRESKSRAGTLEWKQHEEKN